MLENGRETTEKREYIVVGSLLLDLLWAQEGAKSGQKSRVVPLLNSAINTLTERLAVTDTQKDQWIIASEVWVYLKKIRNDMMNPAIRCDEKDIERIYKTLISVASHERNTDLYFNARRPSNETVRELSTLQG